MPATIHHHQTGKTTHLPSGNKSWYTTPNPFETQFRYHRAIKRGPFIFVSGTTALKEVAASESSSSPSSARTTSTQQPTTEQEDNDLPSYSNQKLPPKYTKKEIPHHSPPPPTVHPFLAERESRSKVHHATSAKLQAQIAMERCVDAVERLGGKREDVVRVRMFVAHHADCTDVGAAFRDCFGSKVPRSQRQGQARARSEGNAGDGTETDEDEMEVGAVATMIVVQNGFVDSDILVEVEVDAVVV